MGDDATGVSAAARPRRAALRIALIYAGVAGLWILASDRLLDLLVAGQQDFVLLSIVKGLAFVGVTATLLYYLVSRQLSDLAQVNRALAQANAQLAQFNAELETRVRQRTAELEALNRSLDGFVHTVSHDLKAPLRGIDGYSRLLLEDHAARLDADGQQMLRNLRAAAVRMQQLIDDLLAYSRMERKPLSGQPVDLAALISEVIASYTAECAQRNIELQVLVPSIKVQADAEGLRVALRNLIDNAVKFTAGRGQPRIELGARAEGDTVCLWVRDNGIGFDMRYHDRIFELFQRLQPIGTYAGNGMGLAIVRRVIERMGGQVWAESAQGQGSVFFIRLPLAGAETRCPEGEQRIPGLAQA